MLKSVCKFIYFIFKYSNSPLSDPSTPKPEAFRPPNAIWAFEGREAFIETIPKSNFADKFWAKLILRQ